MKRLLGLLAMAALIAAGCQTDTDEGDGGEDVGLREGCAVVDVATSPEKFELLQNLAASFNDSDEAAEDQCVSVRVSRKSSGAAATALADGWRDEELEGPRPTIWTPSSSLWGAVVNQRLADRGERGFVPSGAKPFMLTPLVIAMPKPMADALGYPNTAVGYADLLNLARDPNGWASKGHPEWGAFKLGKTNPNFSTSALAATTAQYYAATGKVRDLSLEDLDRPDVEAFTRGVESSVVHYGDITLTFLNNWFRNDARGTALTYVSAVAVEEKSVIDYNRGNPDGITDPGESPRPPKIPLVAVYPKEGTLFSDNPLLILNASWVSEDQKAGARRFEEYVRRPAAQRRVLRTGFRPGNPAVAVGAPINRDNGVDPAQPQTTLGVPDPPVLVKLIEKWGLLRKGARVLLVLDVSGSMGDPASPDRTKLELAKEAAIQAIDQFKADDLIGLRIFTTSISPREPTDYLDLVPIGPVATQREAIKSKIRTLTPLEGTPLYTVARASYQEMKDNFDRGRINAVVLLTDGRNEDDRNKDLDGLLSTLRAGSEGSSSTAVRLFTIAYGEDADLDVLRRMSEATNAASYDASDPETITRVFTAVISNF